MVGTLEQAIAQTSPPSDADQKQIGRKLSHVEKLDALRQEIDEGIHSLDAGKGVSLNMEGFRREKNLLHDRDMSLARGER